MNEGFLKSLMDVKFKALLDVNSSVKLLTQRWTQHVTVTATH